MKRTAFLLIGLIAVTVIGLVLLTYKANEGAEVPGYMEADLVLVGSEQGGRIATLSVKEGDTVTAGGPIFTLESSEQEAAVAAAKSRLEEAQARLADAKAELQRPREIEVLQAALTRAQAMLKQSSLTLDRVQTLYGKGWVSKAQLDDAVAQHDSNQAAVAEADKRIAAAKLPGRSGVIEAAAASVAEARHALDEAEKNLASAKSLRRRTGPSRRCISAPARWSSPAKALSRCCRRAISRRGFSSPSRTAPSSMSARSSKSPVTAVRRV